MNGKMEQRMTPMLIQMMDPQKTVRKSLDWSMSCFVVVACIRKIIIKLLDLLSGYIIELNIR